MSLRPARAALSLVMLAGCTGAGPSAGESVPPASEPDSAASASPAASESTSASGQAIPGATSAPADPIVIAWSEHDAAGEILSLVADGDRFVAVGLGSGDPQASWTSGDGVQWTSHPVPIASLDEIDAQHTDIGPEFASRSASMGPLVRLGDTLYSMGYFNFMDFVRPVGWYWTDGAAWQAVTSDSAFYDAGGVRDIIASDDALVAARSNLGISWIGADSTVWTWRSATSWVQSDLSVGDDEPVSVTRLAYADGLLLATGFVSPADETETGTLAAWTSSDGDAWTRIEPPDGGREICALEPNPAGGFVALGVEVDRTVAWTWDETSGWAGGPLPGGTGHAIPGPDPFFGYCGLIPVRGQLLAVTGMPDETPSWTSPDGSTWTANPDLPAAGVVDVAAIGDTIVLATVAYAPDGTQTDTLYVGTIAP